MRKVENNENKQQLQLNDDIKRLEYLNMKIEEYEEEIDENSKYLQILINLPKRSKLPQLASKDTTSWVQIYSKQV